MIKKWLNIPHISLAAQSRKFRCEMEFTKELVLKQIQFMATQENLYQVVSRMEDRKIELNKNQQVVLEWLKWSVKEQGNSPMDAVYLLVFGETLVSVSLAYIALTPEQQIQVLAAFSKEVAE